MNRFDEGIARTKHLSVREKAVVVLMLVAIFASCMVPVSQAARNRELQAGLRNLKNEAARIEEEQRLLSSLIAEARLPAHTLRQSVLKGLSLEKIMFEDAKIVSIGE
jgi:hypothetical protein